MDLVIKKMLPRIAEEQLADYVDIFCEKGYFTNDDTKRLLEAANKFGIQAKITSVGGSTPLFNVYRDPGLDGSSFQLMFNGTGIDVTNYTDNIVSNGVEYCYRIASVYDLSLIHI